MSETESIRRDVRWLKGYAVAVTVAVLVLGGMAFAPQQGEDVVRTQRLVVVDSTGQERIVLAAPIGTKGRKAAHTGMIVNDPDGTERMGIGVDSDGSVGLGLDVPRGVGDPRNRERMNLTVYPEGHAQLRFLDNETKVQGRFLTDTAGALWFEFLEWSDDDVTDRHRLDQTALKRLLEVSRGP